MEGVTFGNIPRGGSGIKIKKRNEQKEIGRKVAMEEKLLKGSNL